MLRGSDEIRAKEGGGAAVGELGRGLVEMDALMPGEGVIDTRIIVNGDTGMMREGFVYLGLRIL